jgi:hypothetical protein
MAETNGMTQRESEASDLSLVEEVDDYLREAYDAFKQSNTAIKDAAGRVFDYREVRIVVRLAKMNSILVEQMGEELDGFMNEKQQAIYNSIQAETKELYERLWNMLKPDDKESDRAKNRDSQQN